MDNHPLEYKQYDNKHSILGCHTGMSLEFHHKFDVIPICQQDT